MELVLNHEGYENNLVETNARKTTPLMKGVKCMTVKDLIQTHEEIENLDAVSITRNHCYNLYEGEDIDFIDDYTLSLEARHHMCEIRYYKGKLIRVLNVECVEP